jgi:hypothetical protein
MDLKKKIDEDAAYQEQKWAKEEHSPSASNVGIGEESSYQCKPRSGTNKISGCSCGARDPHMHRSVEVSDQIQQVWDNNNVGHHIQH